MQSLEWQNVYKMVKKKLNSVLKGTFLVSEDSFRNWRMIIFLSLLAIVMIASSHSADRKVHEIARLTEEVKEHRSAFIDGRSILMDLKMESTIRKKLADKGILPSLEPPKKIKVKSIN